MTRCPNCAQELEQTKNLLTGETVDVPHFWSMCIRNLRSEVERLHALIAQVEWVDGDWVMFCPWCNGQQNAGHNDDCPIRPND